MIDTHTHLNLPPLSDDHEKYFSNAIHAGVSNMMIVGVNIETSKFALELARNHPELWVAVGIHPEEASLSSKVQMSNVKELQEMIKAGNVSAIGEMWVGL